MPETKTYPLSPKVIALLIGGAGAVGGGASGMLSFIFDRQDRAIEQATSQVTPGAEAATLAQRIATLEAIASERQTAPAVLSALRADISGMREQVGIYVEAGDHVHKELSDRLDRHVSQMHDDK